MTVSRIDPSRDVINGGSTVLSGVKTQSYDGAGRPLRLTTTAGVASLDNLDARHLAGPWEQQVLPAQPGDTNEPASSNLGAVVYYAASGNKAHSAEGVEWSYNATPSGNAYVQVESPSGTVLFKEAVTSAGPGFFPWPGGKRGQRGKDMLFSLSAGGAGVKATVNVNGHRLE